MKLYMPGIGDRFAYPLLRSALTRTIRPELIENNYDMMIRYATAIRQGTAFTEALPRRFQGETTHPAYSAMLEVGCAQRTLFLARWLRDRDLHQVLQARGAGLQPARGAGTGHALPDDLAHSHGSRHARRA